MQVNIPKAVSMITSILRAGLVPMISGSPAIGKSSIAHQFAATNNLKVIDIRLAQCDPTDLSGFPSTYTDEKGAKRSGYIPMDTFPIESDPLPKDANGKEMNGWLLFMDELTSAPRSVQAAAYKVILDRMVGHYHLHKNVYIVGAGNLETDNAVVEEMSTALKSRLIHMELVVDLEVFKDYALKKAFDPRVTSFLNFKPNYIYSFRPDSPDSTYASPRTWEFANKILKVISEGDPTLPALMAGTLGHGVGSEFATFCKIHESLPKLEDILNSPKTAKLPADPGVLFALVGSLSHHTKEDNIDSVITYVSRMDTEFQVVCFRDMIRRDNSLMSLAPMTKWISANASLMF